MQHITNSKYWYSSNGPWNKTTPSKILDSRHIFCASTFSFNFKQSKICIGGFILAIKMILVHQLFLNIPLIQVVVVH